jgi:phosphatidylglycerol:prolipoprotein diacylglycerol transferase
VYPRLFHFGSIAIPTSGAFTAIAIVAALFTARATAKRLSLNPEKVWDMSIAGILAALFAPRLLLIFSNWGDFRAHPLWMIGIVHVRSPWAIAGGVAVAIAGMGILARAANLPWRRAFDSLAPALALGFTIYDVGNFIAGANFGTPTNVSWAVTYTRRLASIWNQTPLGTPIHPVQIYAATVELCIFLLFLAVIATPLGKRMRDGELIGAWLFLHGLATFFLDFLRGGLTLTGLLQAQLISVVMLIVGTLLWL